ncbi:hypothetical protein BaOVIS_016230 [Babesia ovis]|uniref:Uncharacterized protein n=1 Tax=Babesia ovis TaxID=5869 RepID=A0A9W5TE49_BABOV|nr:hypothetical protein BaOVIS_016230 [Babesia ovis]
MVPMRLYLLGIAVISGAKIADTVRTHPVVDNSWVVAGNSGMYPIADLICHAAGCHNRDTTSSTIDPQCGSQTICQHCPVPAVTKSDICYLSKLSPNQVNVAEGHLSTTNSGDAGEHEENEHEEGSHAFLEVVPYDMHFTPSTTDKELKSHASLCHVDKDGYVDLSIRVMIQWYKIPGKKQDEGAPLFDEDEIQEAASHNSSFLQFLPNVMDKLKSLNPFKRSDDDDSGSHHSDDGDISEGTKTELLMHAGNYVHSRVKRLFTNPKLHIHFSVNHRSVSTCRQSQQWKGKMEDKSLLFTAVQNFKIQAKELKPKFLKDAVKVHVTCKHCEIVDSRSCVQITCNKKLPPTRRFSPSLHATQPMGGIMQPSSSLGGAHHLPGTVYPPIGNGGHHAPPFPHVGGHGAHNIAAVAHGGQHVVPVQHLGHPYSHASTGGHAVPQHVLHNPHEMVAHPGHVLFGNGFGDIHGVMTAILLMLLCTIEL